MKQKERKLAVQFVIICLLLCAIGFCVGKGIKYVDWDVLMQSVPREMIGAVLTGLYALFTASSAAVMAISCGKLKRMVSGWNGEDEEEIQHIEQKLNFPMAASSVIMIFNYFLFSCSCYYLLPETWIYGLLPCVFSIINMIVFTITIQKTVTLEKQLNPEKQGSPLSIRFRKEWMDSCDEMEKVLVWRSGYAGYVAGNSACLVMWTLSFLGQFIFHTGILPAFCVCTIWLIMTIASMRESIRLT